MRRNVLRIESERRAREPADLAQQPVEPAVPEPVRDARRGQRLADGDPDPAGDRDERGQQRHHEPDDDLEGDDAGRDRQVTDVEVGEAGGELGEAVGAERGERERHQEREHGVGEHEHEVQPGDLAVAGADRLHDPDLARLLGEDRRHRVDHEEPGHHQRQGADEPEDEEEPLEQVVGRVAPGDRDVAAEDRDAGPLDARRDVVDDGADAVLVEGRVGDLDVQLVEGRVVAEVLERVGGHVPRDPARVERGRRADLVREPDDREGVLLAVGGLDAQRLPGLEALELERAALHDDLVAARRPAAGLRRDEVEALVGEVGERRQQHLAVRAVVVEQADGDAAPRVGLGDALHLADAVDEVLAERAREDRAPTTACSPGRRR